MPTCAYCGKENDKTATRCFDCGTEFADARVTAPAERVPAPLLHAEDLTPFLDHSESFTQFDWTSCERYIAERLSPLDYRQARDDAVAVWAVNLAKELGGGYSVARSIRFVCVSEMELEHARRAIRFAEHADDVIRDLLRDSAWQGAPNPLLMLISEMDDYDAYVSPFQPEGTSVASAGMQIRTGFPQIVVHFTSWHDGLTTMAHEMSHACVAHLPLPFWVDEGIALTIQKRIGDVPPPEGWSDAATIWSIQSQWTPPLLTEEIADRHHAFWDEERLQGFWAGTLFHQPGDPSELSYSLAELLVHLIAQDFGNWLDFLARARWGDAGQTAALDCFGKDLGEIAGTFLGEGEWRPVRKKMVELWKAAGWEA
jgi:hypothetical protein